MIEIICGEKGKGKTKVLLDKVNSSIATAAGNVVYLDKSQKHMYELNNKVRLINVVDYPITNCDEFLGFICGIVSQDHDLEEMYLDSFLTIASIDSDADIVKSMEKLDIISEKYKVRFILSVSKNKADLPECAKAKVIKSLESKIAELKELRDEKIAEVKDIMNQANVMELTAGAFTFKLTEITRNNIDTKTLKTKYAELYKALLKVSSYMKFDIV